MNENTQYLPFWVWATLLDAVFSSFFSFPDNSIFLYSWMKFHCAYVAVFLTHSSVDQLLGWFHIFFCMKVLGKLHIKKTHMSHSEKKII